MPHEIPQKQFEKKVRKKITMQDNPFDCAEPGQELEIFGIRTCLGVAGYDNKNHKWYGGHIAGVPDMDRFFDNIPENARNHLKYLTFGYIPMPKTAFKVGYIPGNYNEIYVRDYLEELKVELQRVLKKYGLSTGQFIYRDSASKPENQNLDTVGVILDADSGTATLYAIKSKGGPYEKVEKLNFG